LDAIEEFRYLVLAIQREGNKLFASHLRPLGITPAQAEVIRVLAERGFLSMSELGRLLVCETGGSPSRLVDRLVIMRMVDRLPGADRRSVRLELTARGAELAERVSAAEAGLSEAIGPLLDDQPLDATLQTLRSVSSAFPAGQALIRRING
jgi:MarR family transcriptional regulator, organic hydroperoxide resistance regulator